MLVCCLDLLAMYCLLYHSCKQIVSIYIANVPVYVCQISKGQEQSVKLDIHYSENFLNHYSYIS